MAEARAIEKDSFMVVFIKGYIDLCIMQQRCGRDIICYQSLVALFPLGSKIPSKSSRVQGQPASLYILVDPMADLICHQLLMHIESQCRILLFVALPRLHHIICLKLCNSRAISRMRTLSCLIPS